MALLLVLPFHHSFKHTGMVAPQINEDMTDTSLCSDKLGNAELQEARKTSQIASKKAKEAV